MPPSLPGAKQERHDCRRRVVIVDDHDFFAACLRSLLDAEDDLVVCDVATAAADLGERVRRLQPDLLVVDLSLGADNGIDVALRLRGEYGIAVPILFTSTLGRPTDVELARVRDCAFIAKTKRPAQFLTAVRGILAIGIPSEVSPALQLAPSATPL